MVAGAALFLTSCEAPQRTAAYTKTGEKSSASGWNYEKQNTGGLEYNDLLEVHKMKSEEVNAPEGRKVIYNASLEMSPRSADTINARLLGIAHKHGGYVLSTGPKSATIRVRSADLNITLDEIGRLGKVKNKKIWGSDVTEEYTDLEIRLDNLKKTRARYLELLQKANNVSETLTVEKELERLSRELDIIEGKLNRLSHLTEYSTIEVYYYSKPKPGPLGYVFVGLYKGVKWLFVRG